MARPWRTSTSTKTRTVRPWSKDYGSSASNVPTVVRRIGDVNKQDEEEKKKKESRPQLLPASKAILNKVQEAEKKLGTSKEYMSANIRARGLTPPTSASTFVSQEKIDKAIADAQRASPQRMLDAKDKANITQDIKAKASGVKQPGLSYKTFGEEFQPIYKDETLASKVGKGIVNYGLGTVLRAIGGGGEALAWLTKNIINVAEGKPIDDSRVQPYDLLPDDAKKALDDLQTKKPVLGQFLKALIGGTLDPATYIGGMGMLDDLARAGVVGKSATLGTTENLLMQSKSGPRLISKMKSIKRTPSDEILKASGIDSTVNPKVQKATGIADDLDFTSPQMTQSEFDALADELRSAKPITKETSVSRVVKEYEGIPITKEGNKFVANTDQGKITATTEDVLKRKIDTANSNPKVEKLKAVNAKGKEPWEMTANEYVKSSPEAKQSDIWKRTKKTVDEWRKKKPNGSGEMEFRDGDIDRGYARYIDEYFDELPDDLKDFWNRQNIRDLETGEMNLALETGVRGGHVWQVREHGANLEYPMSEHGEIVSKAIKDGKPVPESVLKDYPDLRKVDAKADAVITDTLPESSVRGKKGELLAVYHGTTQDFKVFRQGDIGFHFGNKTTAMSKVGKGKNTKLITAHLDIKNPVVINKDLGNWNAEYKLPEALHEVGAISKEQLDAFRAKKLYGEGYNSRPAVELRRILRENGYDGIKYQNWHEGSGSSHSWIAFDNNQIHLVDDLRKVDAPTTEVPRKSTTEVPSQSLLADETGAVKLRSSQRPDVDMAINKDAGFTTPDTSVKIAQREKTKLTKDTFSRLYTKFINRQNYIGKFSKAAKLTEAEAGINPAILASNTRNTPGIIDNIYKKALANKSGEEIGVSFKSIVDRIGKNNQTQFEDYILNKHNISRMEQGKPVFGDDVTADISRTRVAEYEARFPEFKGIADDYNKFMKTFMGEWANKSGLITDDLWRTLQQTYPDYVPTYRAMSEAESIGKGMGKKGFVNQSAGIKKATGSERPLVSPLESTMDIIERTVRAAKNNEVGQAIVKQLRTKADDLKGWAEIVKEPQANMLADINKILDESGIEGLVDGLGEQYQKVFSKDKLNRNNIVRVMENGNPVYVKINDPDFLEAVIGLTSPSPQGVEKIGRIITGPFKALITGKNPIFAYFNAWKDIPTAYINGSIHNPVKFIINLKEAAEDIAKNAPKFREYRAIGGGQANFFKATKLSNKSKLDMLYKQEEVVGRFNNTIEDIPRYAEYRYVSQQGGNTFDAKMLGLNKANNITVNFSQSGPWTKTADAWVPYLNPSVQGITRIISQLKNKPLLTIGKGVLAITIPDVAFHLLNRGNPNYQDLSNRIKDSYYNIPNYFDLDENGWPKSFIRVPKAREYGVLFGALFDRIARAAEGDDEAFKDFANTVVTNFAPTNPIESNILSPATWNLAVNKDFAGRSIVSESLKWLSPRYQYDETTSEMAKFMGDKANLSPKQIDYLIKSYTGVIGQFLLPMTTKSTYAGNTPAESVGNFMEKTLGRRFISDPLYSNDILRDFYDYKSRYDTAYTDFSKVGVKSKDYNSIKRKAYQQASDQISEWFKLINKIQNNDMYTLAARTERAEDIRKNILNKAKAVMTLEK